MAPRSSLVRFASTAPRRMSDLLDRQKEAARLLATGLRGADVAELVGYSRQRVYDLRNHDTAFQEHLSTLHDERDKGAVDIRTRIATGASKGVELLLNVLTDGTEEAESADIKTKVGVAQDLLDREGSAPKVSRQHSTGVKAHIHLRPEDILRLKERMKSVNI